MNSICFVGNYAPRCCGIATFTHDLRNSVMHARPGVDAPVAMVVDATDKGTFPREVRFEIAEQDRGAYRRTAAAINASGAQAVSLQHEFGIFGGPCGSWIIDLLEDLTIPVITTCHTVLKTPSPEQRHIIREIARLSQRIIVMARKGAEFLQEIYDVPAEKIEVIQHGIPDLKLSSSEITALRETHGWGTRPVMLTFGLLSPNKGIEHAIRALPEIVRNHPGMLYVVAGATHPNLVREQGETYRNSLIDLAEELGVSANVQFINRFVSEKELVALIGAADLYLTPYLNEAQITSGTLAFAFGLGKPVISTPYWYAEEMLSDGAGILVPFSNSEAIAAAASGLLSDESKRSAMSALARERGASMGWKHVGTQYADLMESFLRLRRPGILTSVPALAKSSDPAAAAAASVVPFIHLERMTGEFGIFQHASLKQPDPVHGFCADDNARVAILLATMDQEDDRLSQPTIASLRTRCVASLTSAYNPKLMRFRNFMNIRGQWLEDCGSEDSHGRVLWALGTLISKMPASGRSSKMVTLFLEAALSVRQFTSPRAWAFTLMGLAAFASTRIAEPAVRQLQRHLSDKLLALHRATAGPRWNWFEDVITYDNAKIPEALLATWEQLQQPAMLETGLSTLEFLLEEQTAPRGHFRPVGCDGFWVRGGRPARFDQQPLEAQAMVAASLKAAACTRERAWMEAARDIHRWFTGYNDHGMPVADAREGGCHDGLTPTGVNGNMGAESTLAFLQATTDLQAASSNFALRTVRPDNITPIPVPARERGQMIPA